MKKIKTIIFDMDGTLYEIDGKNNGYLGSSLEKKVNENAFKLIQDKERSSPEEAKKILEAALQDRIGISNYLSNRYNMTRRKYFDLVWNISPVGIVQNYEIAVEIIKKINKLNLNIILLTAAPITWQQTVISYLGLNDSFSETYTGESFEDKGEIFEQLAQRFSPTTTISIGDQFDSDIKPAESLGFLTILVKSPNDLQQLLNLINK